MFVGVRCQIRLGDASVRGRWEVGLVLYFCCPQNVEASDIVARGFADEELVPVTDHPPKDNGRHLLPDTRAIVFFGVPYDFPFDKYPLQEAAEGTPRRLIPGHVFNVLPRALWE